MTAEIEINTIDDVLPHLEGVPSLVVANRGDYLVVDYAVVRDETFATAMRLQCRGLKFAPDDSLLARPFHKFFNLGERQQLQDVDWSQPHVVLDKLDGSMIHPCMLSDRLVFMTRGGITDQANAAAKHATDGHQRLSKDLLADGFTPIFEFTSPDNRIVLTYPEPTLTLVGVRHNQSGRYLLQPELEQLGQVYDIAVVKALGPIKDARAFLKEVRQARDVEGYVVAFDNGHRLKIKSDSYALKHKALSSDLSEKTVLAWVLKGELDDFLPLLSPAAAQHAKAYAEQVLRRVDELAHEAREFAVKYAALSRKELAAMVMTSQHKQKSAAIFAACDGKDPRAVLMRGLEAACTSDAKLEQLRELYGMDWKHPPDR
ncbi:MAG: hypothetical protein HRU11_09890 [Parvularculaceae bacterium]|nr:hypothetical protein [Parvularculaceae bacterium]